MKVLIVLGHTREQSLCSALADAYQQGATEAGSEVTRLDLHDLAFDPILHADWPENQPLEPDLQRAQQAILDADHLVFVYPTWWGSMPALLKGFLDRVLAPGFAFRFHQNGRWDKLLAGRSAELITTLDTPPWVHRWINRRPGHNAMRHATLGFCGMNFVGEMVCATVAGSSAEQRRAWLDQAHARGHLSFRGGLTTVQRARHSTRHWLQALRLQFYPMTLAAYGLGTMLATGFNLSIFLAGYLLLFVLEAATVFINDLVDEPSDRINRSYGPFSGGSRVLVVGLLDRGQLWNGVKLTLLIALPIAGFLLTQTGSLAVFALLILLVVSALGYSLRPFRLSARGLGELDVAWTHSAAVILWGFLLQGDAPFAPEPWLVSLPLFFSVFGAITLAGLPDHDADKQVGKRSLAVLWGPRAAIRISMTAVILSLVVAALLVTQPNVRQAYAAVLPWMILHGVLLIGWLFIHARSVTAGMRIDGLLVCALSFILWFCLPQLFLL